MKHYFTVLLLLISFFGFSQTLKIPKDTMVVTNHTTTIKNIPISYKATTGTQPVWSKKGEPIATLYYTYYERSNVKNKANRPLVISFNGGPGSASVWMHIAYTGPKVLNIDNEGYPLQPYGVKTTLTLFLMSPILFM